MAYVLVGTDTRGQYKNPVFHVEVFDTAEAAEKALWERVQGECECFPEGDGLTVEYMGEEHPMDEIRGITPDEYPSFVAITNCDCESITYVVKQA